MHTNLAQLVVWTPMIKGTDAGAALLANGLHCWWMVISHLCKDDIATWQQLKKQYSKASHH